ncbi:hypothetical protein JOC95_001864 [Bacillus tianshenii]|uniref:Permuted papain-like amidase enzyme, YaeF/YiiX, C92 family n=1 Tax=Sutcliffiella tianshenii TaxID=1463404 RepID=A0ABS2P043_9BACI|nr:hypothetical protein [Bacillus tianshenii]MBM7620012.1 hypothetical protein [Bacillus tianshenii]
MKVEAGDLIFVKGNCYASPFIRFFLKSNYTHVTIALDEKHICEVDLFTKMEVLQNPYTEFDLYRLKGDLSSQQKEEMVSFLRKRCLSSRGYDWWRIVSLLLQKYFRQNIIIHSPERYICSEIIDKAYQHLGIDLVEHRVTGDVTPLDLISSPKLLLIDSVTCQRDLHLGKEKNINL